MEDTQVPQFPKSPVPQSAVAPVVVTKKPIEMDFLEALKQTIDGKSITRLSWETNATYVKMLSEQLNIFINGEFHSLTVSPGDITATDWIVLPEQGK